MSDSDIEPFEVDLGKDAAQSTWYHISVASNQGRSPTS